MISEQGDTKHANDQLKGIINTNKMVDLISGYKSIRSRRSWLCTEESKYSACSSIPGSGPCSATPKRPLQPGGHGRRSPGRKEGRARQEQEALAESPLKAGILRQ